MEAIILAGGYGRRLRSILHNIPKPMISVWNKPFLAHLLDYLKSQGFTDIILSVSYLSEQIEDYFKTSYNHLAIRYAKEEQPLGTGGALVNAMKMVDASHPVFIINGDTYLKLDYRVMAVQHAKEKALMTMALYQQPHCERYGLVNTAQGLVIGFEERGQPSPGLINAGVYLMNPSVLKEVERDKAFSFEKDFLEPQVKYIKPKAFMTDDYFIDIGVPEDYEQLLRDFSPE